MPTQSYNNRLGFHYYPDTLHYRELDLATWLPELSSLGAAWLTLSAPTHRAIPENFILGLIKAGIQPIIHFTFPANIPPAIPELTTLLECYARWGVKYVVFFDRPNTRKAWPISCWAQANLVEHFLDLYLPMAQLASKMELTPVFPALEPGGDYWDTAFLRASLESLERRSKMIDIDKITLAAYAWPGNRSLNWGAGGPERWPTARPYDKRPDIQDQRGFRIFDWYQTLARAILGRSVPIILAGTGSQIGDQPDRQTPAVDAYNHATTNLNIAKLACGTKPSELPLNIDPLPPEVIACNFWLLTAASKSPHIGQAWFKSENCNLPIVEALRHWQMSRVTPTSPLPTSGQMNHHRPIAHYLLVPIQLEKKISIIQAFIDKYHPTIGFSTQEACLARRVSILGSLEYFSPHLLEELSSAGCTIEQLDETGINLAP